MRPKLFDFPDTPERLVGRSAALAGVRGGGSRQGRRPGQAGAPRACLGRDVRHRSGPGDPGYSSGPRRCRLRNPSGAIDGIVIVGRHATRRSSQAGGERIGLPRAQSESAWSTLSGTRPHAAAVAETLVPQFADNASSTCSRGTAVPAAPRSTQAAGNPAPGTWAAVGEQIDYPEGHFCQQAMARLDSGPGVNLSTPSSPARTQAEHARTRERGADLDRGHAPLVARGELLGVISLAMSPAHRARGAAVRHRRQGFTSARSPAGWRSR